MRKSTLFQYLLSSIFFISLIVISSSCSGNDPIIDDNINVSQSNKTVFLRIPEVSRAIYDDNGLHVSWEKGDKIRIYPSKDEYIDFASNENKSEKFTVVGDENKPIGKGEYHIFYPADKTDTSDYDKSIIDMTFQKQIGNNSTKHLKNFTFLYGSAESLDNSILMKHKTLQVKFFITVPENVKASQIKKLKYEISKPLFTSKCKYDGSDKTMTKDLYLDLQIDDSEINDDNHRLLTAYMMLLPTDLENCDRKVSLLDENGQELASKQESGVSKSYLPGYQYYALLVDSPDLNAGTILSESHIVWNQFGPGMSGNNKVAFWHPTDENYLYISPNMGNSYLSTDAGKTYQTMLNCDAPGYKIGKRGARENTSIDFSRQNDKFGFGTDQKSNGLYKTIDKGKSWFLCNKDMFQGIFLSCVTVDPKDDNIWYLGAGGMRIVENLLFPKSDPHGVYNIDYLEKNINKKSLGKVWKSTDKGKTWKLSVSGLDSRADVESIIVNPNNSNIIYLSSNFGFYLSKDAGKTWRKKDNGLDNDVIRSLSMHYDKVTKKVTLFALCCVMWKANGNTITDDGGGIFKSTDDGESWTKISDNLAIDMTKISDYNARKDFYATASYFMGMSQDDYKAAYPLMPSRITQRITSVRVDPSNVNNIFAINDYSNSSYNNFMPGQLWRSKDGGNTWFITMRDGSMWSSASNSSTDYSYWSSRGNPMGNNITFRYLKEWLARDFYERKSCNFVAFNCTGKVIHAQLAKISLMSYDGGDNWVDVDDEYTDDENVNSFVGAGNSNLPGHGFYQDERFPGKIFCSAGENQLWITNDKGENVRKGALGVTNVRFTDQEMSLSCYAINPKDPKIHYALFFRQYNKGKLMISYDTGKTWSVHGTAIDDWKIQSNAGDQSVHQLCLIIDKNNPNNMYFCVPWKATDLEYVGDSQTGFGVHKSSDGGKTWRTINSGLPITEDGKGNNVGAPSVSRICFDPKNPSILYAAVERKNGGLYKSTNNGETWNLVESTKFLTHYNGTVSNAGINDIHFAVDGAVYITVGSVNADKNDPHCGLWVSYNNMNSWTKLFSYANTSRVETARYNPKIILVTALANYSNGYLNPGTYLSRDGGITWAKSNLGNGQSDRVNDIAIDYTKKGRYYASTYGSGWYFTDDELNK